MANESSMTVKRKDVVWEIDNIEYVVRSVPHIELDDDGEEFLDTNVSMTLLTLRDLMVEKLIPSEVNFEKYEHIEF